MQQTFYTNELEFTGAADWTDQSIHIFAIPYGEEQARLIINRDRMGEKEKLKDYVTFQLKQYQTKFEHFELEQRDLTSMDGEPVERLFYSFEQAGEVFFQVQFFLEQAESRVLILTLAGPSPEFFDEGVSPDRLLQSVKLRRSAP